MASLDAPYGLTLDGAVPASCDMDVLNKGEEVYVESRSLSATRMEKWVQMVATRSGQRVDWYKSGNEMIVMALGDIETVSMVVEELQPELTRLYLGYLEKLGIRAN